MDAILIFGIPYFVSLEPGDVWGSDAFGGKEMFLEIVRRERERGRNEISREIGSDVKEEEMRLE